MAPIPVSSNNRAIRAKTKVLIPLRLQLGALRIVHTAVDYCKRGYSPGRCTFVPSMFTQWETVTFEEGVG